MSSLTEWQTDVLLEVGFGCIVLWCTLILQMYVI
jgi:hypothetical protein